MYRVTTSYLGPDGKRVSPGREATDRGELGWGELAVLLDSFVTVDASDNEEFDPSITVTSRAAKIIIRTSRGRLQVYDGKDHAAPAVELTQAQVLEWLEGAREVALPPEEPAESQPAPSAPHRGIAFAMLLVGLILNGYILYSVFYVESVNKKPEIKLLTDPEEIRARQSSLLGIYSTGAKTGDRVIEVTANGQLRFFELGIKGPINDLKDTYVLGRHDGIVCLSTVDSGVVDIVGENLVYFKDVYYKKRPSG